MKSGKANEGIKISIDAARHFRSAAGRILFCFILFVLSASVSAEDVRSVGFRVDAQRSVIAISRPFRPAAELLQRHLEIVTGKKLRIVYDVGGRDGMFEWHVGAAPADAVALGDGAETGFWRVTSRGAWFWGGPDGVRHAVLDFLENGLVIHPG